MKRKIQLSDGSYSVSDIQDYFQYILKKYEEKTSYPLIRIYVNKIKNRITFKIKTVYYLEPLAPEMIKLLEGTKTKIAKEKKW